MTDRFSPLGGDTNLGKYRRLLGAIRSRKRAAYLALAIKLAKPVTQQIDEKYFGLDLNERDEEYDDSVSGIMIVSPPRSGSTIVYQTLVRVIPSVYISNLHALFPYYASRYMYSRNLYGSSKMSTSNYYGYTSSIYDVYEANEFFSNSNIARTTGNDIRCRFTNMAKMLKSNPSNPIIFKNVAAYNQLLKLHNAVPELVFVHLRRNPERTIQSIVRAYHELGTFNPIPDELKDNGIRTPVEFAVRQYLTIEKTIERQKSQISESKWLEWSYEGFCANSLGLIETLAQEHLGIDGLQLRPWRANVKLRPSTRVHVNKRDAQIIKELIQEYQSGNSSQIS